MSSIFAINLALILFLPWFAILGFVFLKFPRAPRSKARIGFDLASLLIATALAVWGMQWGYFNANPGYGGMWHQILATSVAYGLFLLAMLAAVLLRWRLFRTPGTGKPLHSRVPSTHHQ